MAESQKWHEDTMDNDFAGPTCYFVHAVHPSMDALLSCMLQLRGPSIHSSLLVYAGATRALASSRLGTRATGAASRAIIDDPPASCCSSAAAVT